MKDTTKLGLREGRFHWLSEWDPTDKTETVVGFWDVGLDYLFPFLVEGNEQAYDAHFEQLKNWAQENLQI